MHCNQSLISQCGGKSVGAANQLATTLIQTLLAVQCSLSPPDMWPSDYGKIALEHGLCHASHFIFGRIEFRTTLAQI